MFSTCLVGMTFGDESSSSGSDDNADKSDPNWGKHVVQPFCRRDYIKVSGLWLTCDTPGAYYYGSSAYRKSQTCMSGDKANLRLEGMIDM